MTLASAKLFLRVGSESENDLITALIVGARVTAEAVTGRQFINATWTWNLDRWPSRWRPWADGAWDANRVALGRSEFAVPFAPLASVTSIKYLDPDGAQQTLSTDVYNVVTDETPGKIRLAWDQSWPETRVEPAAIEVIFVAGYGAAGSDVPEPVRDAILMMVDDVYNHRSATVERALRANPTVDALLNAVGRVGVIG